MFCIPIQRSEDTCQRCRRIRRYLRSVIKMFFLFAQALESEENRPPNFLGSHFSDNSDENRAMRKQLQFWYLRHAEVFAKFLEGEEVLEFDTQVKYVEILISVLSSLDDLPMRPPWLLHLDDHSLLHLDARSNFWLFCRHYLPAVATHVEVVAGKNTGKEFISSSSSNNNNQLLLSIPRTIGAAAITTDDEGENPTGCR